MENEIERSSQEHSHSFLSQDLTDKDASSLECERLWYRLKNVQKDLVQSISKPVLLEAEALPGSQQNHAYEMLQEYEKRLRAELIFLKEKGPEAFLSQNKEIQCLILHQDQMRRRQQLKETLSFVKAKHSSLVESIKQEEELNTTLMKIQNALKTKDQALSQTVTGNSEEDCSADAAILDLKTKVTKVKQANKHFQNSLVELLSDFPSPPEKGENRKSSKNALDNTRDFDEENFISLSSIIGQLMEKTLNSPDAYIDVTDRMWPQHIEFLLRSEIIVKDPDRSTRIKLLPFHL